MRQITLQESQTIAGGYVDPATVLVGTALTVVGLSLIFDDSYYYAPAPVYVVDSPYVVDVYDNYGYVGSYVDYQTVYYY